MTAFAALPVPSDPAPPPERPERHSGPADFVAGRVLGETLPCLCPDCRERQKAWDVERAGRSAITEMLPPAFWNRQAARLSSAHRGPDLRWGWVLVPAAGFLLAFAILVRPARLPGAPDDFSARWVEVQEALERSALGDLEACALLIDGGENSTTEESQ